MNQLMYFLHWVCMNLKTGSGSQANHRIWRPAGCTMNLGNVSTDGKVIRSQGKSKTQYNWFKGVGTVCGGPGILPATSLGARFKYYVHICEF